jgi:hypothetical protein
MAGRTRPDRDEALGRMRAWGDEWRDVAGSTAPADRPRAEAAITSLYVAAGKPEPVFAWVPSPAAGIQAYTFACQSRRKIPGRLDPGRRRQWREPVEEPRVMKLGIEGQSPRDAGRLRPPLGLCGPGMQGDRSRSPGAR